MFGWFKWWSVDTFIYIIAFLGENKDRFWVTFNEIDAKYLLKDEKACPCYYPTNRNIINLTRNTIAAIKVLFKENSDILLLSGVAGAVPFFILLSLYVKLVYIEVLIELINRQ